MQAEQGWLVTLSRDMEAARRVFRGHVAAAEGTSGNGARSFVPAEELTMSNNRAIAKDTARDWTEIAPLTREDVMVEGMDPTMLASEGLRQIVKARRNDSVREQARRTDEETTAAFTDPDLSA
jgi:hypothetical protein